MLKYDTIQSTGKTKKMKKIFNNNLGKTRQYTAFTLAEVLITLGIIGIVAQMTIPALMNNVNDLHYKTAYKNTYSILSQAIVSLANDNNGTIKGLCADSDNTCLRNTFANYLKSAQQCSTADMVGKCWATSWTRLNGDAAWSMTGANEAGLNLVNGTFLVFESNKSNCDLLDQTIYECAVIEMDINGLSNPNKIGKDIFFIHIMESTIKPYGTPGDWASVGYAANGLSNYYMCNPKGDGEMCAFDYLFQ